MVRGKSVDFHHSAAKIHNRYWNSIPLSPSSTAAFKNATIESTDAKEESQIVKPSAIVDGVHRHIVDKK